MTRAIYQQVGEGVISVDTEYVRPRMDASHLIVDSGRAAFVDVGTAFSMGNLLTALAAQELDADSVDYLILTHIHLDHAGGAGHMARALPRARVLVHPRGAAHLIDPTMLIAATKAVYGQLEFEARYGDILPVPADRVDRVEEGLRAPLGRRTLEFMHTPGHALHHLCIVDRRHAAVFTGDTFGVSYRELDSAAGPFVFPTTSPSQFDPMQLHASIERILETRSSHAYLTHYSRVDQVDRLGADLQADVDVFVRIAKSVVDEPDRTELMKALLFAHLSNRLDRHGYRGGEAQRHAVLDGDIALNAAGLDSWLSRRSI